MTRKLTFGMSTIAKRKIAFALTMGIVTTGIISFSLIAINIGLAGAFMATWLRSWLVAYMIVIPVILIVGPRLQSQIDSLID